MKTFVGIALLFVALPLLAEGMYVNVACRTFLPCNSAKVRHSVGSGAAVGAYISEKIAVEGEFSVMEDKVFLAARGIVHFSACDEFNLLFGYERFDPYFSIGANTLVARGQTGPEFGVGAYYYLSDNWALRADVSSTVGVEGDCDAIYSVAVSLQKGF